jgi:hypothetical protein
MRGYDPHYAMTLVLISTAFYAFLESINRNDLSLTNLLVSGLDNCT